MIENAFGGREVDSDADSNGTPVILNLRFPGQYYDAESGLHDNHFGSYDARVGRYTQSDPIGLSGGLSTFSYVGANPHNAVDPHGLSGLVLLAGPKVVVRPVPYVRPLPPIEPIQGMRPDPLADAIGRALHNSPARDLSAAEKAQMYLGQSGLKPRGPMIPEQRIPEPLPRVQLRNKDFIDSLADFLDSMFGSLVVSSATEDAVCPDEQQPEPPPAPSSDPCNFSLFCYDPDRIY